MRLLTANDIEDEDDDEHEHDRRIEEGRDQSFDAASGRRFEYRAKDGAAAVFSLLGDSTFPKVFSPEFRSSSEN